MSLNELISSDAFKEHLAYIDRYAKANSLDKWAARIVLVGLMRNVLTAKRFAQRRPHYKESRAWECYSNLVRAGVFSEDPEGIVYEETPKYETDEGVKLWLESLILIADGMPVPAGFPCIGYQKSGEAPQKDLVSQLIPGWDQERYQPQ